MRCRTVSPEGIGSTAGVIVALSTWTLDPIFSARYPDSPEAPARGREAHTGDLEIFDVPREARARGFDRLEVPHFHLPADEEGQARFAKAAREAGVLLQTLLIDDGDLAHPGFSARDEAWASGWIDAAGRMGFERVRIIAGKQERTPATFSRSLEAIGRLVGQSNALGVRASTENWHALLSTPESVLSYLGHTSGLGLCADFGNWSSEVEETGLPLILPIAETIHAKAEFSADGEIDETRFRRQVLAAQGAGFHGPYVLVAGGPGDPWDGAARTRDLLQSI